ncbi:MAG: DUF4469 domain-containing protein [Bacteroidales bacterium]|jgi:hypothetical protein|nr:DUF4469 domain-containing protein [Bacteroidales bacterium]
MANIFHRIKAILIPNLLTEDPDDFYAKAISERTLGIADICASAVLRGNAPTTAEAMKINVELFLKEMEYQLKDGYSVNTGWFTATPQIKGVFAHAQDRFDPERHSVHFLFNQGDTLRKGLGDVSVEISGTGDAGMVITTVTDVKTGSVNDRITPNRNLRIRGNKIKLAGDHPEVGIYFVNEATGEQTKVAEDEIVGNKPSELMIVTPSLAPGMYILKIVSRFSGNALLKEPRTATLDKPLTLV